ncbi:hypothetical protein N8642_04295 [bacterium]|nr:hypothetical protein [bacterium]
MQKRYSLFRLLALILPLGWYLFHYFLIKEVAPDRFDIREIASRSPRRDPVHAATNLARSGRKLTSEQVEKFEKKATDGELSERGRVRLFGYYEAKGWDDNEARRARARHILWFVENRPEAEVLRSYASRLDPRLDLPAYVQAKALWMKYLEKFPENLTIMANAAELFRYGDSDLCIEILKAAGKFDPDNGIWAKRLGDSYRLRLSNSSLKGRNEAALLTLNAFERAYRLLSGLDRSFVLDDLARWAYLAGDREKALKYSKLMVEAPKGPIYRGRGTHHGHTVFGLIAMDDGDVERAKEHLLDSVTFPVGKSVTLFSGDFRLARRLVELGEAETVKTFIEEGSPHVSAIKSRKLEWLESLDSGIMPNFEGL